MRSVTVVAAFAILACAGGQAPARAAAPVHSLTAVQFATLPGYRVRGLVAGADSARRIDAAMMVWVIQANDGRVILVDAGFTREKFVTQWRPRDYVTPDSALRRTGFDPGRVSDIIISHVHWDHADGVSRFPQARVWIQRAEFEYYVGVDGSALQAAIDPDVARTYRELFNAGRVQLVDGDDREILPGVRVYTGGKHTFASQYVAVRLTSGTAVVASDNAYLYENLEGRRPIALTLDSLSNLAAQRRMLSLASRPDLVVPGHDPAVFARFGPVRRGAVVIR